MQRYRITQIARLFAVLVMAMLSTSCQNNQIDTAAEREKLLQVDRDFDQATADQGVEGWVAYFTEEGMMLPAGENLVRGKAAIREEMAPVFGDPSFSLRWSPTAAEISQSGDLGYTYGAYVATSVDKEGKSVLRYGKYVTIWKKQADGSWKAAVDIGNSSPAPMAAQ